MKTFFQFYESIIDPKRKVGSSAFEKFKNFPEPEDDDYDPDAIQRARELTDDEDDDDYTPRSVYGLTAQYPLAKASGKMRGFQIQSPEDHFKKHSEFDDRMPYKQLADTLRSKLYSGEPMSNRELNFVMKAIDKEYARLASYSKRNQ